MAKLPVFWKLYILFFCVPFPMFIYYMVEFSGEGLHTLSNPYVAILSLIIAVSLWLVILVRLYKRWIIAVWTNKKKIKQLMQTGKKIPATILKSRTVMKAQGHPEVRTEIQFENFSGTLIIQELIINDSRPALKRYEAGNTVQLRVDPDLKFPHCLPDGVQVSVNHKQLRINIAGWIVLVSAVTGYLLFSYYYQHNGHGWRFLSFWHPFVLVPLCLLLFTGLLGRLSNVFSNYDPEHIRLTFYGKEAVAQVISAKQTGTYINEQPQIKFELEFQDYRGNRHLVSIKKIINLLDLGITRQEQITILYLPDNPQKIAFI